MAIPLPSSSEALRRIEGPTPREIVAELDRHVIGQTAAKRAVAVALRNRMRRRSLPSDLAAEITPKNILMIGPTGVGKTEIARRLARLSGSPFLKVEASKFTEVGYVGRDVESMVRDLTEVAVDLVRREKRAEVEEPARRAAEERLLDALLPMRRPADGEDPEQIEREREQVRASREKLRVPLRAGQLDHRPVEIEVQEQGHPGFQVLSRQGVEEMDVNLKDWLPGLFGGRTRRRSMPLGEARKALIREEEEKLLDPEEIARQAVARAEASGIIFVDEIDKIAGREAGHGPEVSREGVQRDLLPLLEGSTVATKRGPVRTDHVLFIAAGAFHVSRPSDLIPELQGRFPIRVELDPLRMEDLVRILVEPRNSLVAQYVALLGAEGVKLTFGDDAIHEIARVATEVNESTENIGARRLATILETVLDEISFAAGEGGPQTVHLTAEDVRRRVERLAGDHDLSRFVL